MELHTPSILVHIYTRIRYDVHVRHDIGIVPSMTTVVSSGTNGRLQRTYGINTSHITTVTNNSVEYRIESCDTSVEHRNIDVSKYRTFDIS